MFRAVSQTGHQGLTAHDLRLFLDEGKNTLCGAVSQAPAFGKRVVTGHVPFQHPFLPSISTLYVPSRYMYASCFTSKSRKFTIVSLASRLSCECFDKTWHPSTPIPIQRISERNDREKDREAAPGR